MAHEYEYYRRLITSEYRNSPKFMDWHRYLLTYKLSDYSSPTVGETMKSITYASEAGVGAFDKGIQYNQPTIGVTFKRIDYESGSQINARDTDATEQLAERLISAFDVDTAEGPQLDILGAIVGINRMLKFQPTDASPLMNDEDYRLCIKAKIIRNQWKGNAADLHDAWMNLFPDTAVFEIQDLQDMSFNIVVSGNFTSLQREIITNGYIIPKPEGVRINQLLIVDLTGFPLFAYDYNTLYMSGYGAHWATNANQLGG